MSQNNQNNELNERIITIYESTYHVNKPNYIPVEKALSRIKNGKIKDIVEKVRSISDKKERDKLKANKLTAYNFQGKFTRRSNDGIHSMSGLIPLDFDHLKDYNQEWNKLIQDDYTFACFRSPSGDGIKVLVKVPPEFKNFKKYFEALRKYYNMEDYAGWDDLGDISRLCFESYDPNLYYNPNSKVFDMMIKEQTLVREFADDKEKLKEPNEIYRRIKAWSDRTNDYYDGNKHRFLVYIASACNRFGLDAHFVAEKLVNDYQHKASPVDSKDIVDIVKRVYITYAEQHGNSFFNVDGEMNDFDPESPARDVIYLKDIKEAMIQSYLHGDAKGETTYFNSIDPHWRWKRGEITIMQGVPNHGKCQSVNSKVLMADGSYKEIGQIKKGDIVKSFDNNHNLVEDEVVAFEDTGKKEVFELKLSCGFSIECTKEHKIYTSEGWKTLQEIQEGDYVCTPRDISNIRYNSNVSEIDAMLIATWLTEGSKNKTNYVFHNGSEEFIKTLENNISTSGFSINRYNVDYKLGVVHDQLRADDVLKKYGVFNCKTDNIFIPHEIMNSSLEVVSTFISTLINCDGCVTKHGIEYTSNSKRMCFELCMLLRRYGCISVLNKKKSSYIKKCGAKFKNTTWRTTIKSATQAKKLLPHLKLISYKQKALEDFCDVKFERENIDVFPSSLRKKHFKRGQKYYKKIGVYLKNGIEGRKCSIHTNKAKTILEHHENEIELARLNAYSYNKVISIKSKGLKPTCDIQTKKWFNFISNGIVTHNSTLTFQLMLVKSIKDGAKWGIFSPEQNPPIDFYKDLIHMYIGKSTESYHPNQMSLAEYHRGMEFIHEHFYFVYPKDDQPTPKYINDRFEELIIKHEIDGCVIDPFNQLINEYSIANYRDDKYIEIFLSGEKRFALDNDIYKIIVCHPNGSIELHTDKNADKNLKNEGNHKMPNQYNLAGGAMWFNKADNILCTYQPYYLTRMKNSRRKGSTAIFETYKHPSLTQFVSQKIKKQKLIGVPGTANLYYDSIKARFYEELSDFEPGDDSKPYREKYCPFDPQYVLEDSMTQKETEVSETDWSAFKKTEEESQKKEEKNKQEKEDKKYKEDLKIDEDVWSNFANEANDMEDEDFDQIDGL